MKEKLTESERSYVDQMRQEKDKFILKRMQRIFMKYEPSAQENCLCTPTKRKLWREMFLNWYDNK